MSDQNQTTVNVSDILDRMEKRVLAQVARDLELLGPIDENEVKERIKKLPTGLRGPFVFAFAGLPRLRQNWIEQDRMALGEGFAQMVLRSMACYLGSEDFNELVGIGRVFGESEVLLAGVLGQEG
ncbi:MAG: hypothetical protein CMJ23_08785 [Phycisphaerae bacterium]|nr:hypothetical protein [Phycisphaerae bacterium]|tara:strand:+ start:77 stop:451 length:375 start_codon:yes stop_codon:yes gene_type:complete